MTYRMITCDHCHAEVRVFRSPSARFEPRYCGRRCYTLHKQAMSPPPARFESYVDKTSETVERYAGIGPCWLWTAQRNAKGYGVFSVRGRPRLAHRVAWSLENAGEAPRDRLVCHRCDNPRCVRASHLFLGTAQDNTDDMVAKGRQARGAFLSERVRSGRERHHTMAREDVPSLPFPTREARPLPTGAP
jgi:hypothetical protein